MYRDTTAILAVSSLDRFTRADLQRIRNPSFNAQAPISPTNPQYITVSNSAILKDESLEAIYNGYTGTGNKIIYSTPVNNFTIPSPGALIYGYIKDIAISQVQMEYKIPTVVPTTSLYDGTTVTPGNDTFYMVNTSRNPILYQAITIPYGFYNATELAQMLTTLLDTIYAVGNPNFLVSYLSSGGQVPVDPTVNGNCFLFASNNGDEFYFPDRVDLELAGGITLTDLQWRNLLRTYRLLGITSQNGFSFPNRVLQQCLSPTFLYTSYIDICSQNLTKYQKIKDTDTSVYKRDSILARIYLSGVGLPDPTTATTGVGCQPFILTSDLNTPKIIRWSQAESVYQLDFQVYDQFGDELFWDHEYPTEFQMTLLCTEGED
jgi:hypothetical protein